MSRGLCGSQRAKNPVMAKMCDWRWLLRRRLAATGSIRSDRSKSLMRLMTIHELTVHTLWPLVLVGQVTDAPIAWLGDASSPAVLPPRRRGSSHRLRGPDKGRTGGWGWGWGGRRTIRLRIPAPLHHDFIGGDSWRQNLSDRAIALAQRAGVSAKRIPAALGGRRADSRTLQAVQGSECATSCVHARTSYCT